MMSHRKEFEVSVFALIAFVLCFISAVAILISGVINTSGITSILVFLTVILGFLTTVWIHITIIAYHDRNQPDI